MELVRLIVDSVARGQAVTAAPQQPLFAQPALSELDLRTLLTNMAAQNNTSPPAKAFKTGRSSSSSLSPRSRASPALSVKSGKSPIAKVKSARDLERHNVIERARRTTLKKYMERLKEILPEAGNAPASNTQLALLTRARDYSLEFDVKNGELETQTNEENARNQDLQRLLADLEEWELNNDEGVAEEEMASSIDTAPMRFSGNAAEQQTEEITYSSSPASDEGVDSMEEDSRDSALDNCKNNFRSDDLFPRSAFVSYSSMASSAASPSTYGTPSPSGGIALDPIIGGMIPLQLLGQPINGTPLSYETMCRVLGLVPAL